MVVTAYPICPSIATHKEILYLKRMLGDIAAAIFLIMVGAIGTAIYTNREHIRNLRRAVYDVFGLLDRFFPKSSKSSTSVAVTEAPSTPAISAPALDGMVITKSARAAVRNGGRAGGSDVLNSRTGVSAGDLLVGVFSGFMGGPQSTTGKCTMMDNIIFCNVGGGKYMMLPYLPEKVSATKKIEAYLVDADGMSRTPITHPPGVPYVVNPASVKGCHYLFVDTDTGQEMETNVAPGCVTSQDIYNFCKEATRDKHESGAAVGGAGSLPL